MEDRLMGNNGIEGNSGAPRHTSDLAATRGEKFATSGGAFVVPKSTGQPGNLLPPPASQVTQPSSARATVPAMQPAGSSQQVGKGSATAMAFPPVPQTSAPGASASLASALQLQPIREASLGATEAKPSVAMGTDAAKADDNSQAASNKKPKKDRSKLRKGKWTPEEEEYTSRIIHYFSTGILTLPEGTTLRAYLAEKLNCDPMRITKKYAGASCLGKRVYHLYDRPPATTTDVGVAKAELAQLEQRFRIRVEHGQTGMPLPPRADFLLGASNMFGPNQMPALLQSLAAAQASAPAPGAFPLAPPLGVPAVGAPAALPGAAALPFLAPNLLIPGAFPGLPMLPPNAQNNPLAALAWAQAAASLTPALNQLVAANLQQQQQELQKAFEATLQSIAQQQTSGTAPAPPAVTPTAPTHTAAPAAPNTQQVRVDAAKAQPQQPAVLPTTVAPTKAANKIGAPKASDSPRSKEDEDAGSMLMGFLSSLRKGYEEALNEREKSEGGAPSLSGHKRQATDAPPASKRPRLPARSNSTERAETASGTTSYPAESSLEDSDEAEKRKQDPSSSSEDSDKDSSERDSSGERGSSSGERGSVHPKKRMKGKHTVGEFTRKNVAEHNHRMDVMRSRSQQDPSGLGSRWPRDERTD